MRAILVRVLSALQGHFKIKIDVSFFFRVYNTNKMSEHAATQSVVLILSLLILNNFLQTDYMYEIVNKLFSLDTKIDLAYTENGSALENRMYMSLLHSLVLIILVGLGALTYFVPITKTIANAVSKK
jgi:hypothetical protein